MNDLDDMELPFLGALVLGLLLIFGGAFYGVYKVGRAIERRDLTTELRHQIESVYSDGVREGVDKGLKACDDMIAEANQHGRY